MTVAQLLEALAKLPPEAAVLAERRLIAINAAWEELRHRVAA